MARERTRQRKRPARRRNEVLAIATAKEPQGGARLEAGIIEHALQLALGAIPAPAFVVRANGEIVRANEAGWAWAKEDAARSQESLAKAMDDPAVLPCRVTVLPATDHVRHALIVLEIAALDEMKSLEQAVRRWSLTPRQAEVLALLAEGKTNRLIAATLGCSERTVEIHVAALLEKADCESRAELIAQFWKPAR